MRPFAPPIRRFAKRFAEAPRGTTVSVVRADLHFGKP